MKGKKAKVNQIFSATVCLVVAFALAVFTCYAWFTSINNVSNGISASVSEGNIVNLAVNYYSLTGKTESTEDNVTTTTYTVSAYLGDDSADVPINAYGSTDSTITLIKVTYTVKDGTATKLIFSGSGEATFPANLSDSCYETSLSNAVSLRLAKISTDEKTVSTSNKAETFCDVSELTSTESQTIDKNNIIFSDINGTQNTDSDYYDVAVYIVMEYSEENVAALYPSGATYSYTLKCTKDISLVVKSNDSTDETDSSVDSSSSDSSASDSSDSSSSSGETGVTGVNVAMTADEMVSASGLTTSNNSVSEITNVYTNTDGTGIDFTSGVGIDTSTGTYSYGSVSCSYRIKTNGTGKTSGNSIKLTLVDGATITVYAKSGSSSEDRILNLIDDGGNVVSAGSAYASATAYTSITYTITNGGIYYLASASNGINIIYISIEYNTAV